MATQRLARILEREGCTPEQWWALVLLADGIGHPMSEVADFVLLPSPTATKLVDRMVSSNLAYRRVDERDRRRVLVFATARGRELYRRLSSDVSEHHLWLVKLTSASGAEQFGVLLDRLSEGLGADSAIQEQRNDKSR